LPREYSLVSTANDNIVIETIKKAEASEDLIVRLYEAYNQKGMANIRFGFDVKEAYLCDLLENEETPLEVTDNSVSIPVSNFEIISIKVKLL